MKQIFDEIFNMKVYNSVKISPDFTNLDYAKANGFPKAEFILDQDYYDLKNGYSIHWIDSENFCVDLTYFDREVGYVTDTDLFCGNFGECLDYVKSEVGYDV
jgi:hypothetical protein